MRLGKELVGKPIFSITDGRMLGTVRDIYVNQDLYWMAGIHLGHEGIIKRKSLLVERENVVVFGIDAILVRDSDVVTDDKQYPQADEWLRLEELRGREVDTPGGTKVGSIGDITLSEEGHITGFTLSRVFVEGPIAEKGLIPREAVIDTGSEDGIMTIDLPKVEQPVKGDEESE